MKHRTGALTLWSAAGLAVAFIVVPLLAVIVARGRKPRVEAAPDAAYCRRLA